MFLIVIDVEVTADRPEVGLGYNVTFTCHITRMNPVTPVLYLWQRLDTLVYLPAFTDTLTVTINSVNDITTYNCEVENDFLISIASFTLSLREMGKFSTEKLLNKGHLGTSHCFFSIERLFSS